MNKIDYYNSWLCKAANMVCLAVCVLALAGCNEDEANSIKEDPYAGGRAPLEVKLLSDRKCYGFYIDHCSSGSCKFRNHLSCFGKSDILWSLF